MLLNLEPAKSKNGFTIVELLIVIVVIGILAAIIIVAYNGIQRRTLAASVTTQLKSTDKAFKLWAVEQGFSRWPYDDCGGCGDNISEHIQSSTPPFNTLKNYIQKNPEVKSIGDEPWGYDNDTDGGGTGDDKTTCSSTEGLKLTGVNVVIRWINQSQNDIMKMINDSIDGPNEGATWDDCGLVRYYWDPARAPNGGVLLYSLSYTKAVQQ